jgi:hypothetical protein
MKLHFKVLNDAGEITGAVHFAEDAAAMLTPGGKVKFGNRIVWREGVDGGHGESYDEVRIAIWDRLGWRAA